VARQGWHVWTGNYLKLNVLRGHIHRGKETVMMCLKRGDGITYMQIQSNEYSYSGAKQLELYGKKFLYDNLAKKGFGFNKKAKPLHFMFYA
jgi:hypothetical protein